MSGENTVQPFRFFTQMHLVELTGLKARNAKELLEYVKIVPGSVIYYHTHHFLQQHQYLSPEPPNDFAYWTAEALNDAQLGEKLASINVCEFATIRELREKIIATIERHVEKSKGPPKEANEGHEFHFLKSVSFVFPTQYEVRTLEEFTAAMKKISVYSIYFHMFEARLRLERGTNDFSVWLENILNEKELARKIARLDPYTHTMEKLREKMIKFAETRISKGSKHVSA